MKFKNVSIDAWSYVVPPEAISSEVIERRLSSVYERLNLPFGRLELMTGIQKRHYWDLDKRPSEASAEAGADVLKRSSVSRDQIDLLIHAGVCRDCMEPATASFVHRLLGLPGRTQIMDISNACLGFVNAMVMAAGLIESGQIESALICSGENGRPLLEQTLKIMTSQPLTRKSIKPYFANLTIGAGASAMLLARRSGDQDTRPKLEYASVHTDSSFNELCRGDRASDAGGLEMQTDSEELLNSGLIVGNKTWQRFQQESGWTAETADHFICHQVGKTHQRKVFEALGLDLNKDHTTYEFMGNVGSVSLPLTFAYAADKARFKKGDKLALLGIGSGLSSMMLGVEWR